MHKSDPQTNPFTQHYRLLELNDRDDWETARVHYRRLVNLWHPDRFAQRPREKAHAQQQFINLTKSYNALRNFYRKNHRLPFQSAHAASKKVKTRQPPEPQTHRPAHDETTMDDNLLAREPSRRGSWSRKPGLLRKLAWLAAGGTVMAGTIMFFLVLDRNANRAIAEQGREIVKDAPKSEFMPTAVEIRRSKTRGAFIKPTQ